jgi:hypothetical protein
VKFNPNINPKTNELNDVDLVMIEGGNAAEVWGEAVAA